MRLVAIASSMLVACGTAPADALADLRIGHGCDCSLEIQLGLPSPVSVIEQTSHPCLRFGQQALDDYIASWTADVCWPAIDKANAAGIAPGGGDCGGYGCDCGSVDLCFRPEVY